MTGLNISGVTLMPCNSGQWCRLGLAADTTITVPGQRNAVEWDVQANNFPTVFDLQNSGIGGTDNAIQCLVDGVYAVTWGLYLDVFSPEYPTNSDIFISFEHTTWTHEEEVFAFPPLGTDGFNDLASPILTGTKVFRSGPTYDQVYMCATIDSTADADLAVIGGDLNITYMEIVFLSCVDAAFQGDPNDFITGP